MLTCYSPGQCRFLTSIPCASIHSRGAPLYFPSPFWDGKLSGTSTGNNKNEEEQFKKIYFCSCYCSWAKHEQASCKTPIASSWQMKGHSVALNIHKNFQKLVKPYYISIYNQLHGRKTFLDPISGLSENRCQLGLDCVYNYEIYFYDMKPLEQLEQQLGRDKIISI